MKHSQKISSAAAALSLFLAGCSTVNPAKTDANDGLPVNSDSDSVMSSPAMMRDDDNDGGKMMQSSSAAMMDSSAPSAMEQSSYKDGTYSAAGTYRSHRIVAPGGRR